MPSVQCPSCRVKLTLPANFAGTGSLRCPKCATVFKPADQLAAEAAPAPAPAKPAPAPAPEPEPAPAAGGNAFDFGGGEPAPPPPKKKAAPAPTPAKPVPAPEPEPEPAPAAGGNSFDFGSDEPAPPPKKKAAPARAPEPESEADDEEPAPAKPARGAKVKEPARPRYGKAAAADTGKKKFPTKWVAIGGGVLLVVGIGIAIAMSGGGKPTAGKGEKEKEVPKVADKGKEKKGGTTGGTDKKGGPTNVSSPDATPAGIKELFDGTVVAAPTPLPPPVPLLRRSGNTLLSVPAFTDAAPAADPEAGKLKVDEVEKATTFIKAMGEDGGGTGTGFVIRVDGTTVLVATNQHVVGTKSVADPKVRVSVVFNSGIKKDEQEVKAEIIAIDPIADLAILRVNGVKDPPKPLDPRHAAKPTRLLEVRAFGYPLGNRIKGAGAANPEITTVKGAVSRLVAKENGDLDKVQMDINLNPGNSGGPVVDTEGRLVGVAVSKIQTDVVSNIGFAVPVPELMALMAGRINEPRFSPGKADGEGTAFDVTIPVSDPFGQLKTVALYYKAADESGLEDEKAAVMPGATKKDFTLDGAKELAATLSLPIKQGGTVFFQLACTNAAGKTGITRPVKYTLGKGPPPRAAVAEEGDSLAELNASPEKFEGQQVTFRGRLGGEPGRYRSTIYDTELIFARSRDKALNLMAVMTPDFAEQLKDMPAGDSFLSIFLSTRITVKVGRKGSGENGLTPVRVVKVEYITPDGEMFVEVPSDELAEKFPLIALNRNPDKSVGKTVTFEAIIYHIHDGASEIELTVHTMLDRQPSNLKFMTTRDVVGKIQRAGGAGENRVLPVTLTVRVEDKKVGGQRVVTVTGVEPLRKGGGGLFR